MNSTRRILIIRLSSLGDILHTLPAFWSLRQTFPDAAIDWVVEERNRFLVEAVAGIDNVLVVDSRRLRRSPLQSAVWKKNLAAIRRMRSRRYDVSLDFQGLLKTAFLGAISGARTRIGFSRQLAREPLAHWFYNLRLPPPVSEMHITAQNQLLAGLAGAGKVRSLPDLRIEQADIAEVDQQMAQAQLSEYVVINPGGGWYTKRWDPVKYGELARRIGTETGLGVVVTTGPGEEPLYAEIVRHAGNVSPIGMTLSFLQLVPLLRSARLFIGGDTGPFHLACALGTPVVGILGPTSPARNGPWTAGDEAVVRILPCSFCNGRTCPTGNECMDISVEAVFESVVKRLRTSSPVDRR